MSKPDKKIRPSRITIEVKVDEDACRAAKAAFAECGLSLGTAIELFLCQAARRFFAAQRVDEAHDAFASIDELMEYLDEREAGRPAGRVPGVPARKEQKALKAGRKPAPAPRQA